MTKFYLYVRKENESEKKASVKGFTDLNELQKEKAFFERLDYICTIKTI